MAPECQAQRGASDQCRLGPTVPVLTTHRPATRHGRGQVVYKSVWLTVLNMYGVDIFFLRHIFTLTDRGHRFIRKGENLPEYTAS